MNTMNDEKVKIEKESLKNKIDFALIFTVKKANPNGDPLNGNRPRVDYEGFGEVSDVCLKRKLRNRLQDLGEDIFVQSEDNKKEGDEFTSLRDRYDYNENIKKIELKINKKNNKKTIDCERHAKVACETWYDVRAFGQVFAFKKDKKSKKDEEENEKEAPVSIGIRGPVTIHNAVSINPVDIHSQQITKSVNLETESDGKKGSDTMGMKHRVEYGVYVTYGSINCQLAEKTGFSESDAEKLLTALVTLFENDESSARPSGSMKVEEVVWWKHNCKNGQYASADVHDSIEICLDEKGKNPCVEIKKKLEGLEPVFSKNKK